MTKLEIKKEKSEDWKKKGGTSTCFTRPDGRRLIGMHSGTYCVTLCGACRTCEGSS